MMTVLLSLYGFLLLVASGLFFYHQRKIQKLETKVVNIQKDCTEILRDHPSLVSADLLFYKQLKDINGQLVNLEQHIQSLDNVRENDGGYQHALRILDMGGSREEIVNSCHLSNAEAELLMNLQAYRTAIKANRS